MKKSIAIKRILVFSTIMFAGVYFLYSIHLIGVISVLIVFGIGLSVSGIPSERIAPYPSDVAISFVNKVRGFLKSNTTRSRD